MSIWRSIYIKLYFFSAPEHYRDHALSVVRRQSVLRPSVVNFSHFRLLLWSHWTEFNETWQEIRTQHPLPSLCFSGRSEKQDCRPGLWLAEKFSTSPLKPLNGIQRKLTGSKISMSSTRYVFFRPIGKNKIAALASDGLRHFRLLLWNRWTEFNETWQDARSQRPLPSLCFSGQSEQQDGRPCLWLAYIFATTSLKPLNGIQRNLTGSKISMSSTKIVYFGPIGKTRWPPWPLIGWDIFVFSSETTEWNSPKPERKQDLNVLYQGFAPKVRIKVARVRFWIKGSWRLLFGIWVLYVYRMLNITYQVLRVDWHLTLSAKIGGHVTLVICYWPPMGIMDWLKHILFPRCWNGIGHKLHNIICALSLGVCCGWTLLIMQIAWDNGILKNCWCLECCFSVRSTFLKLAMVKI